LHLFDGLAVHEHAVGRPDILKITILGDQDQLGVPARNRSIIEADGVSGERPIV
jgi:hypothetical protein